MNTKVRFIRLVRNEDIVAEVIKETKTTITIKNVMAMITDVDIEDGKQSMVLFPWVPYEVLQGGDITLLKRDVMFVSNVRKDIVEYYEINCRECKEMFSDSDADWLPKNSEELKNSSDSNGTSNVLSLDRFLKKRSRPD